MKSVYFDLKPRVINLRQIGKTYGEIRKILGENIPKSTLSLWCEGLPLLPEYKQRIKNAILVNSEKGRKIALIVNQVKREKYIKSVKNRVIHLGCRLRDKDNAKIALAMLFLGEGNKKPRGSLIFGNSDPAVIKLFVYLLRYCYDIDERKFRCTLQCRADQNIKKLEKFWSQITKIPLSQFYKARIDPRTIGKPSKKPDYKGVCRIDYFSGDIFMELTQIIGVIVKGL